MRSLANIFWLGTKELRSFFHDYVLVGLILWAFSLAVYAQAQSSSQELHNAAIAIIDEDNSSLSHIIIEAFFLLILAAHIAGGGEAQIAPMLSVPVFIVMVGLTRLVAGGLESIGLASLRPLLLLQFLLLAGFLVLCVTAGPRIDPNATNAILAGMLGVSAMAVQNALVQISLKGAPSTAVMTSNVTRFAMDVSEVLLGGDSADVAKARNRAARTLPVIVGFTVGDDGPH